MSESALIANLAKARAINRDDLPVLGQWYWVIREDEDAEESPKKRKKKKKPEEFLACAEHVASNHTVFMQYAGGGSRMVYIMHWEVFERVRPAPEWKSHWQAESDRLQLALREAVKELADTCINANLIEDPNAPKVETLLPAVTRTDPSHYKKALIRLKEKTFPQKKRSLEHLMEDMVGVQKNMFLSEHAQAEALQKVVKRIDDRLFALELYAGFHDKVIQIADGAPAPENTPITIFQMLRYMDEETLIDAEDGGMDFDNLKDFDAWAVARIKTVAPAPRCIVAFQIRRAFKDYGPCKSIGEAFTHMRWHEQNMKTYLLIRNGDQVFRFATALEFTPRLLPLRAEFDKPFFKDHYWSSEERKPVTPQDIAYDECVEERTKVMMQYNRITFLLQGLLDRTKVFSPHPTLALNDAAVVEQWLILKHDEEDGLPSANPPVWEDYQRAHNAKLKPGMVVYAVFTQERYDRWQRKDVTRHQAGFFRAEHISRNKETVTVSEPWGTRWGYEKRDPWGGYYGKYGEWPVNKRRRHVVEMRQVFNVGAYKPGDYKTFLCDPYLKGAYLQWAPFLLHGEKFHKMTPEEKEKI